MPRILNNNLSTIVRLHQPDLGAPGTEIADTLSSCVVLITVCSSVHIFILNVLMFIHCF